MGSKEEQWLLEEKYAGQPNPAFVRDRMRLAYGEPLAYVIGFVDFLGCRIDLSGRPLIPRPETEYWTEKALQNVDCRMQNEKSKSLRVLDLFAGSGCIGIALLKHLPCAAVDFADIDNGCLRQIRRNLEINHISMERFEVFQSDVFAGISPGRRYNVIFANPPYIDRVNALTRVATSVKDFEPDCALFAEEEGLAYIRQLLAEARNFLHPGGSLYLEYDDIQKKSIETILEEYGYRDFSFHRDQFGKWRYVKVAHQ
jgi:release factor glutamine methyltransferase